LYWPVIFFSPPQVTVAVENGTLLIVFVYLNEVLAALKVSSFRARIVRKGKGKGKAVPLQAWSGPEGSRKLRFPYFMTMAQECGKVVSLTHRPHLHPENSPGTHFC